MGSRGDEKGGTMKAIELTALKAKWLGLGLQEYLDREEFLRKQAEEVEDGKDA